MLGEEMHFLPDFPFTMEDTKAQRLRRQLTFVRQGQLPDWISLPALDPPHSAGTDGETKDRGSGFLI